MITPGDLAKMRTTGHTMILAVDTLERYQKALQKIMAMRAELPSPLAFHEMIRIVTDALQEQNGG